LTSIKLTVSGARAKAAVDGVLTSGAVGIPVEIHYDSAWDGLTKNLVCTNGKLGPFGEARVILNVEESATVAHEVMKEDHHLYIGLEGRNSDGSLVISTVWADCGYIHPGASVSAQPAAKPTQPIWAQLQQQINALKESDMDSGSAGSILLDTTLSQSGQAADAKAVGDALNKLNAKGLTAAQIEALDGMFQVCAFAKADVSEEYSAFQTAFGITAATLTGISAVYSGGNVAAGTSVTALTGIVVTASYSDGSKREVTDYTLSGTIKEGSNTITVTYSGMTTTFTVTGVPKESTKPVELSSISAVYSGGDVAVGTAVSDLTGIVVTAHYSDGSSKAVSSYTLSGTIAEGSNTITVSYGGMTTTITVVGVFESGGESEPDILFHVENTQVNALTNTGVDVASADMDYSMCVYVSNKSDDTTSKAVRWFGGMYADGSAHNSVYSPMVPFADIYNTNGCVRPYIGTSYETSTYGSGAMAIDEYLKIVLTHEKDSGIYTFSYTKNLGNKVVTETKTITKAFEAASQYPATVAYGTAKYPLLFHDLTIYSRVLSTDEIASYLS